MESTPERIYSFPPEQNLRPGTKLNRVTHSVLRLWSPRIRFRVAVKMFYIMICGEVSKLARFTFETL